jgi:hypothetical protein
MDLVLLILCTVSAIALLIYWRTGLNPFGGVPRTPEDRGSRPWTHEQIDAFFAEERRLNARPRPRWFQPHRY